MHTPAPNPFALRPADESDRAFCYHLVATTLQNGPELDDVHGHPSSPRDAFDAAWPTDLLPFTRIIHVAGHPVGQLVTYDEPTRVFVKDLELLPPWQSRGLGAAVLQLALAEAAPRPVELKVTRTNTRAQSFYNRLNFTLLESTDSYHLLRSATCDLASPDL